MSKGPTRLVTLAEADALRAVADDDRVTVEWPFSRLVLDEPPKMMVPAAVSIKSPWKGKKSKNGRSDGMRGSSVVGTRERD